MPRGVKGSASSKTSKTATKARATKTKETNQAKKTAEEKELETRLEDITAEDVNETTEVEAEEDIEEEELEEVEEDGTKVSVKITTSKDAGNDVQTGSSKWTEQNQKDLKAFKALPEARQKYYESLTANVLRKDEYVKSGSFVFDAILSDGQGIPLGSFIEITSPAGVGKCVSGDSIVCVDGVFQRIDQNIKVDGYTPCSKVVAGLSTTDVAEFTYRERVNLTRRIKDQYGMEIQSTPEHPYLVLHKNLTKEWVKTKDLQIGDKIIGQGFVHKTPSFDAVYYMRGVFMADGSLQRRFLTVCEDEYPAIKQILTSLGYHEQLEYKPYTDIEGKNYRIYKKIREGYKTVYNLAFSAKESHEFLVKEMYEPMTYDQLLSKIAGLLDTDACVCERSIDFCQKDEEIIVMLQKYLSMLGIVGRRRTRTVKSQPGMLYHRFTLSLVDSCKLASLTIGLVRHVGDKLVALLNSNNDYTSAPCNSPEARSVYSVDADSIKDLILSNKETQHLWWDIKRRNSVSKQGLKNLYSKGVLKEDYTQCVLHEVCELEDVYEPCYVYDYTIPKSHAFLANGLVSHNTSLLLYVCRFLCDSGHRCAYIDTERGLNARQLDSFGLTNHVKSGMFIPTTIDTFEEIDEFLVNALEDKTLKFIVIDSLTQASPKDMIEKTMGENQTMAIHARTVSQFLRRFRSMYGNSDKTIFFVAQNRKQFTMYGAQDGAAGGEAQKHAVDIIVKLAPKDKLKKKVKGFNDDVIYGSNCIIKTEKNRHCSPFIPMMITIIFGKGVSNASALYDALVSNEKIRQKGSFYYIEDINGNEEQIKGKEAVLSYIAQHHEYYIDLVNRLGGIKLPKVS